MFILNILKAAALLMGLNGSADMIPIEHAQLYLDEQVVKFAADHEIEFNEETTEFANDTFQVLFVQAKKAIVKLSYQGVVPIQIIKKIVSELEQVIVYGFPNKTIDLPKVIKSFECIYHLESNNQFNFQGPGVSCGYWTAVNAGAINTYIENHGTLNFEAINQQSIEFFQEILRKNVPLKFLDPKEINWLCSQGTWKLNKHKITKLHSLCKIENLEQYEQGLFNRISQNKLHVVKLLHGSVYPCCVVNNESAVLDKPQIIKKVIEELISNDYEEYIGFIRERISIVCANAEPIDQDRATVNSIDWDYLEQLIQDLDEDTNTKILYLMLDWGKCSLISKNELIKYIPSNCNLKEIAPELELFDYTHNNKLLTLVNLYWVISSLQNQAERTELVENKGGISSLVYFKALSNYFKTLVENNETGALHFACYLPSHWILISVINLTDKRPVLVMMDSMNHKIELQYDGEDIPGLCEWIKQQHRINSETMQIQYILSLYDLFIKGNSDILDLPIANALNKWSPGWESNSNSDEQRGLMQYIASSSRENEGEEDIGEKEKEFVPEKRNGYHNVSGRNGFYNNEDEALLLAIANSMKDQPNSKLEKRKNGYSQQHSEVVGKGKDRKCANCDCEIAKGTYCDQCRN